jgi:molybdopterin-guanine dinucleotide biosynthesis protein B
MSPPKLPLVVTVVGRSNAGKTTLIASLVTRLSALGLRVGTIKHASHRIDLDRPGKDTFRHREAGALRTAALSPDMLFYVERLGTGDRPPLLKELISRFFPGMDVVIAESFSRQPFPRIEVLAPRQRSPIPKALPDSEVIGRIRARRDKEGIRFKEAEAQALVHALAERAAAVAAGPAPGRE